jgi:protein-disulfide isomerase
VYSLNTFFSAIGFLFAFFIYTNAFLNPELSCALGAQNCAILVSQTVFRNFALFLTIGFFLSFISNFAKFYVEKEGYKVAVVTTLLVNLLTFLIAGALLISALTKMVTTSNAANVFAILVWAWTFPNIIITLLEMKPIVAQVHTVNTAGFVFSFASLLFLMLGCTSSLILSNSFLSRKNINKLSEIVSGKPISSPSGNFNEIVRSLERLREDLKSLTTQGGSIDYNKLENSFKTAIVTAFTELTGRGRPQPEEEAKPVDMATLDIENDYFLGPKDAPVTIVEFFAYTCPYCVMLHPIITEVLKRYPDKVKYVAKHFPLDFSSEEGGEPVDTRIAEVVEAAGAQGKFWEMHNRIMDKFKELMNTNRNEFSIIHGAKEAYATAKKYLQEIAKELGLDWGKIEEAVDKGIYRDKIEKHHQIGRNIGVRGTPSLYINGKPYRREGFPTVNGLAKAIEEELKGGK